MKIFLRILFCLGPIFLPKVMAQNDLSVIERQRLDRDREAREAADSRRLEQETLVLQEFNFGRDRTGWNAFEDRMRNPMLHKMSGRVLINLLINSANATVDARILAARGLRVVGRTETDLVLEVSGIQALTSLIRDKRLSGEVCMALQGKSSPDIDRALSEALPLVENTLKRQIMATLGRRRAVA